MRRESIEIPAQAVLFDGDIEGRTPLSAFEYGVLDEMADTMPFKGLVSRTDAKKKADGRRTHAVHMVGEHGETVLKACFPDAAGVMFFHKSRASKYLMITRATQKCSLGSKESD